MKIQRGRTIKLCTVEYAKEQPKLAAMFNAGRYNYHTLITHLFVQEIPGQASRLSYASLTRLSSRVACESLACETN